MNSFSLGIQTLDTQGAKFKIKVKPQTLTTGKENSLKREMVVQGNQRQNCSEISHSLSQLNFGVFVRIYGYQSYCDEAEGVVPIDLQDVSFYASANELQRLSELFKDAALKARELQTIELSVSFDDSKPNAQTQIGISVHLGDK